MKPLVLIVEDDVAIRESLRDLLVDEGYRVAEAGHGGEALRALEIERPAMMLLDLWMPVMTGGQLYERLQQRPEWASIPIVIVTAATDPAPADGIEILRKPLRLEALLATLRKYLSSDLAK
jgi:CheY-like chemotaxis protein